jgi:adenosine deaminase
MPHQPADEAFVRAFPKVELHCHLEGSFPAATSIELASRHDLPLPTTDIEHVYDFDSFLGFLDLLGLVCRSMVTEDDFAEATSPTTPR